MAELIFIPADHYIQSHIHMQDTSGHTINCISPQMPSFTNIQLSVLDEIRSFYSAFGEQLYSSPMIYSLQSSFWSLEELKDWVREHCSRDVYARRNEQAMCFEFYSPSAEEILQVAARLTKPKNFMIRLQIHRDRLNEIVQWVGENCHGVKEFIKSSPDMNGRQALTYYFKEETDETLFRVRWGGLTDVVVETN